MRISTAIALLAASVPLIGCGPDSSTSHPLAPAAVVASLSHQSSDARPIKGSCEITSTEFVSFSFPILRQIGNGVCQISHLGRTTIRTEQTINVLTGVQTSTSVLASASGDLVYLTAVGTSTPTGPGTLSFTGVSTIAGGTGRFENASGQLDASGTVNTATGTGSLNYKGSIDY